MKKNFFIALIFVIGLGVFLFPTVSDLYNNRVHYREIEEYDEKVNNMKQAEIDEQIELARQFNRKLLGGEAVLADPFSEESSREIGNTKASEYPKMLNTEEAIGHLKIPKIDVNIPIYNGVSDDILGKGVGYLRNTSLPVGGAGSHTVITGHRGLPTAKMFRHLDKLKAGDKFYIRVLAQTLAYQVDQVKIVLPTETSDLKIAPESDYATLITCEPYGINSHRLLVRGHRVAYTEADADIIASSESGIFEKYGVQIIVAGLAALVTMTAVVIKNRKKKKNR